jgi:prepilin-type N-terminal cleavage/methylation domain-containing protein
MKGRHGFTLIEIVAVVAVMGILAGISVLTLSHVARQERRRNLAQELQEADALVRSAGRQSGKVQRLVFDLNRNELLWRGDGKDEPTELVRLPEDWPVSVQTVKEKITTGQIVMDYSRAGYTQTFALDLGSAAEASGLHRWMIVAGLSGSIDWTNDEKQVEILFKTLSGKPATSDEPTTRTDAD